MWSRIPVAAWAMREGSVCGITDTGAVIEDHAPEDFSYQFSDPEEEIVAGIKLERELGQQTQEES